MKEYKIEYTIFDNKLEFYVMAENKKEAEKKFIDLRGKQPKITNIEKVEEINL